MPLEMPTPYRFFPLLSQLFVLLLLSAILPSCQSSNALAPIPTRTFDLPLQQLLVIQLDRASLELVGHDETYISISGSSSDPDMSITFMPLEDALTSRLSKAFNYFYPIRDLQTGQITAPMRVEIGVTTASAGPYDHPQSIIAAVSSACQTITIHSTAKR